MPDLRYCILASGRGVEFVEMPAEYAYQLTALHQRLHKEVSKLTAAHVPDLPKALAECGRLELTEPGTAVIRGIDYLDRLEREFAAIPESSYPLISLLTEIRALQAQMEQWYEEEA